MATAVLGDAYLVKQIVTFQHGLPRDLRVLAAKTKCTTLAEAAIARHNLRLLQRVYKYHLEQPFRGALHFGKAWQHALQAAYLDGLRWISSLPEFKTFEFDKAAMAAVLQLTGGEVIAWLFEHQPVYKAYIVEPGLIGVANSGNIELLKWLHQNIADLPVTTMTMDVAAASGQLGIVRFLHENRTEGCTVAAMDEAVVRGR